MDRTTLKRYSEKKAEDFHGNGGPCETEDAIEPMTRARRACEGEKNTKSVRWGFWLHLGETYQNGRGVSL